MKVVALILALMLSFTVSAKVITLTPENHIILEEQFNGTTTATVMNALLEKMSENGDLKDIYLLLDTPGGNVFDGIQMIEFLKSQKVNVHTISFFAASMGFQTVQGLGTRYVLKNGVLMSHLASGGMRGSFPNGSLDATYKFWTNIIVEMDQITADRSGGKHTLQSYQTLIRSDYWCKGQACVDQGFADEVVSIRCNDELKGTKVETKSVSFMGMSMALKVTKSKCPAIRSPLKVEAEQYGKFINIHEGNFDQTFIDAINEKFTNKALACGIK